MLGQRVNNFEIVRLLGEGGMGAVYEAEHLLIKKKVAVKVLKPELGKDGELLQRFFNEARATSAIRHPNIVEVIDLGFLPDGMPYLVMELLEGESLADRLTSVGRLSITSALDFVSQTASALQAAHDNGIVHRDLKPDNLYLVRDQRFRDRELVKVLDFGIAKLHGDVSTSRVDTVAGTIWGTPPYMSPEQCRGLPSKIDHRTDIYALGVILYEALAGEPPFIGEGLGDTMMLHMTADPPPLLDRAPDVPPHVERTIMRALEKKPDARFSSMAEFSAALHGADAPVVALPKLTAIDSPRSSEERRMDAAMRSLSRGSAPAGSFSARGKLGARAQADAALPVEEAEHEITRRQWKSQPPEQLPLSEPAPEAVAVPVPEAVAENGHKKSRKALWLTAALACAAAALIVLPRWSARSAAPEHAEPRAVQASQPAPAPASAIEPATLQPAAVVAAPSGVDLAAIHEKKALGVASASMHAQPITKTQKGHRANAASASATPAHGAVVNDAPSPAANTVATTAITANTPNAANIPNASNAPPGYLSLDSEPWANVSLGGKQLGSTPLMRIPLPPGKHVLTLTNPELGTSTLYTVEVKSGETLSRLVGWRKQ